jgi:hypothetical protein
MHKLCPLAVSHFEKFEPVTHALRDNPEVERASRPNNAMHKLS